MQAIGENLKNARIEAKLSQKQLANLSGISRRQICNIENGKTQNPNLKTLICLSAYLNLDLAELNDAKDLGVLIISARIKANLSQIELATISGVSNNQLINIENGKTKKPHFKTLIRLSSHLDLDLEELKRRFNYTTLSSLYIPQKNVKN